MNEKCFCHLNGYAVKDATARKSIEGLNNNYSALLKTVEDLESRVADMESIPIAEEVSV